VVKRALLAGWRRQVGMRPGVAPRIKKKIFRRSLLRSTYRSFRCSYEGTENADHD
jgi:hypothetical protein